ncbi:MAG TPA: hypothetical protein DCZ97_09660 [Syntrophus sp. (in: bacteria)]|nr:MAG: hypothetical protein A2X92_08220 [Syntrophus sp. GWC2_56_31]HBB17235.1 hypothetical protein [Syntrophus sp. (in: bacteria)]
MFFCTINDDAINIQPFLDDLVKRVFLTKPSFLDRTHCQKVGYQSLMHAYAANRPYAESIAYQPWQGIIIDTLFRPLADHLYAVYPMFAFQNDSTTDNDKYPGLDRFRRLCGGLERIQKANEFYQRHKWGIVVAHIMILLSILIIILA